MISPPVGMNIFVVKSLLKLVSLGTIFRGVTPFTVALVALLALVVAFPGTVLWLPGPMRAG
jgi:TRAP-type C4-dicarboxylate transport system permease large subunit